MHSLKLWVIALLLWILAFPAYAGDGLTTGGIRRTLDLKRKSQRGDASASVSLGNAYAFGDGVNPDTVEAFRWYLKAAEQGDTEVLHILGICYAVGQGVPKDEVEAYAYFNLSAISTHSTEAHNSQIARQLLEKRMSLDARLLGQRRAKQLQEVLELKIAASKADAVTSNSFSATSAGLPAMHSFTDCKAKAEGGDPAAQLELGRCYADGEGPAGERVLKNETLAVSWYRKAAEQGYAAAQNDMGYCYKYGVGVARDYAMAVSWFRKASGKGYAAAQYELGKCYADGIGVAKDMIAAYALFNIAAVTNKSAQKKLKDIEEEMKPGDRFNAQEMTKQMQKEIEVSKAGK